MADPEHPRMGQGTPRRLAVLLALATMLSTEPAYGLPPQVVIVGGWALSWLALVFISAAVLLTHVLPRWLRRAALGGLILTVGVAIAWPILTKSGAPLASPDRAQSAHSNLQASVPEPLQAIRVPEQVRSARDAVAQTQAGLTTLWIDLRGGQAFERGHVRGAYNVPLLGAVRGVFRLDALDWTLTLEHDPRGLRGRLPVTETLARIESLYNDSSPRPTQLLLYCNGGFTSAYIANALHRRGIPARRIPGGIAALKASGAAIGSSSLTVQRVQRHELSAIEESCGRLTAHEVSRESNLSWSRLGLSPPATPEGFDQETCWLLSVRVGEDKATARWAAAILHQWGVKRVYQRDEDANAHLNEVTPLLTLLSALGVSWWWWARAIAFFMAFILALQRVKETLAGRSSRWTLVFITAQTLLALGVESASRHTSGTWLEDRGGGGLMLISLALLLAVILGLETFFGGSRDYWRRTRHRRALSPLQGPVQAITFHPLTLIPGGMTRLKRALRAALVAFVVFGLVQFAASVLSISTLIVGLIAFATPPTIEWIMWGALERRLRNSHSAHDRAVTLLRWAGLSSPPRSPWVIRTQSNLERDTMTAEHVGARPTVHWCLFDSAPDVLGADGSRAAQWARHAAMLIGHDIEVSQGKWRLLNSTDERSLPLELGTLGLELGCPLDDLGALSVTQGRFEGALTGGSVLSAELLALRSEERGGDGRAAARFGGRLTPAVLVRIGTQLWEVCELRSQARRPSWVERMVARSFITTAHEHLAHDIKMPLERLKRGLKEAKAKDVANTMLEVAVYHAIWPAIFARAAEVADRETRYLADLNAHPAYPSTSLHQRNHLPSLTLSYALCPENPGPISEVTAELDDLPSHEKLAYGEGPTELCLWRGRARRAAAARDIARAHYISALHSLGEALVRLQQQSAESISPFDCPLEAVLSWLKYGAPLKQLIPQQEGPAWPSEFSLAEVSGRVSPGISKLSGEVLCGDFPLEGDARWFEDVERSELKPSDIVLMPRLKPEWVSDIPPVKAIITASKATLSHGAILAREAGIPTVIGLGRALELLAPGSRIRVDAEGQVASITLKAQAPDSPSP